jgi:hypothetical protein
MVKNISSETAILLQRAKAAILTTRSVLQQTSSIVRVSRTNRYRRSGMFYMPAQIKRKKELLETAISSEIKEPNFKLCKLKVLLKIDFDKTKTKDLKDLEVLD